MFVDSICHGQGGAESRPDVVKEAMDYASRGWRVVALHYPGEHRKGHPGGWGGKEPCVGEGWQAKATTDEGQITEWFDQNPKANVGVAFGRQSGIIDIECDDEAAAQNFDRIFAGVAVVTPTFKSSKGLHRIFKWTDSFPSQGKASIKKGGLEFRLGDSAKGSQSVFPPSLHATGVRYQWLPGLSPSECDPMEIPLEILARISVFIDEGEVATPSLLNGRKAKPQSHWDGLLAGVSEGGRHAAALSVAGKLARELDLDNAEDVKRAVRELLAWDQRNSPPLQDSPGGLRELENVWEYAVGQEGIRRTATSPPAQREQQRTTIDAGYRLIRVDSKPVRWKLFHPRWGGHVLLTTNQLETPRLLRQEVQEQKRGVSFDCYFANDWLGSKNNPKGILGPLQENAEVEEPDPEDCRDRVVANLLWSQHFVNTVDGEAPDTTGRPKRMKDGAVWFKTEYLLTQGGNLRDFPDRREINEVLRACGVLDRTHRFDKKVVKFRVLGDAGITALENLAHKGARHS